MSFITCSLSSVHIDNWMEIHLQMIGHSRTHCRKAWDLKKGQIFFQCQFNHKLKIFRNLRIQLERSCLTQVKWKWNDADFQCWSKLFWNRSFQRFRAYSALYIPLSRPPTTMDNIHIQTIYWKPGTSSDVPRCLLTEWMPIIKPYILPVFWN